MHILRALSSATWIAGFLASCGGGTIEVAPRRTEIDVLVRVPCATPECGAEPGPTLPPLEPRSPATMLALGWNHSCALTEDGGIYCWGSNNRGQLGDIESGEPGVPQRVPGLGVMDAVWAGGEMTCAREARDGTIQCWGDTGMGPHREPGFATPLPFSGVRTMALGYKTGCLVDESNVFCWGDYGRPHGPIWSSPQRVTIPRGVSGLVAGMQRHCGLDTLGRVNCWGRPLAYWTPERVQDPVWRIGGLAGVRMMALAGGPMGRPWIVDRRGRVQRTDVGEATRNQRSHEVELHLVEGIENPASLVAGNRHACARLSNGTAACWGDNARGQVGDGTTAERREARYLPLTGVQEIATGQHHTCARATGGVFCWGGNRNGQAGAGSPNEIHEPAVIPW